MARQVRRISDLPEAGPLAGDELLEIVQGEDNKRIAVSMLADGGAVQSVQGRTGDVVITADDVELGNVDNTSDADKPISTAQQTALDGKVDKVAGMGLSSNDLTDPLREKLIGIEAGAQVNEVTSVDGQTGAVDLSGSYEQKRQNNLTATTDPTADDDASAGYEPLSRWINTSTGEIWLCVDATDGAANWQQATLTIDELGSAALADVGLGQAQVPTNGDLGSAALADTGDFDPAGAAAAAQAFAIQRSNHTGTQAISTVAGLQDELDAIDGLIGDIGSALDAINGEVI